MKSLIAILLGAWICALCNADTPAPVVGEWNYTNPNLCIKLKAGIRLDIDYVTNNGTTKTATIVSDNKTTVDNEHSYCFNSTSDTEEIFALKLNEQRELTLYFTRDKATTKDESGKRWLLYRVKFDFDYDPDTFPDSQETGKNESLSNNSTLSGVATNTDRSFSCSKTGTIAVTDHFKISFTNLRVQAFITGDDFSQADHCAADQETTDLIPIIIGAALAALVIIVLVAYLIGRARANTPAYDNMK